MATKPPDAFLSYTRFNDRDGRISAFRGLLEDAVKDATGEPFKIFQDVDGIGIGEHWPDKLDQMLDEARFFIPIVTQGYFTSGACREELERFLHAEAARGRKDLVLPIYWIEIRFWEDTSLRAADPLAAEIYKRQRHDWRQLRFSSSFSTKTVRTALHKLALEIDRARRRPMPEVTAPQTTAAAQAAHSEQTAAVPPPRVVALTRRASGAEPPRDEFPVHWKVLHAWSRKVLRDQAGPARPEALRPGTVFRDFDALWCPEMVVIPSGEFMMGSPEGEEGREEAEGPQHSVMIGYPLAVGSYPVTFEEYDHFARVTARELPSDEGGGRGRRPAINVSWIDAKAYTDWLSLELFRPYRLLSEAEWEYACRADSTTRYWWGDEITPENANGDNVGKTTEVGAYPANPWGLYDTHGNVWELVEDCWHPSYEGAPDDGSAWTKGDHRHRVIRGGRWFNNPEHLRSASRNRANSGAGGGATGRSSHWGFRVARPL